MKTRIVKELEFSKFTDKLLDKQYYVESSRLGILWKRQQEYIGEPGLKFAIDKSFRRFFLAKDFIEKYFPLKQVEKTRV